PLSQPASNKTALSPQAIIKLLAIRRRSFEPMISLRARSSAMRAAPNVVNRHARVNRDVHCPPMLLQYRLSCVAQLSLLEDVALSPLLLLLIAIFLFPIAIYCMILGMINR